MKGQVKNLQLQRAGLGDLDRAEVPGIGRVQGDAPQAAVAAVAPVHVIGVFRDRHIADEVIHGQARRQRQRLNAQVRVHSGQGLVRVVPGVQVVVVDTETQGVELVRRAQIAQRGKAPGAQIDAVKQRRRGTLRRYRRRRQSLCLAMAS